MRQALRQIDDKQTIVFIKYFQGISTALRLLKPTHCIVMDIRTGSVCKSLIVRRVQDAILMLETKFYKHITVISQSLSANFNISQKAHILPIGSDIISSTEKNFNYFHLLYVGTLFNRNLEITINGFKKFFDEHKGNLSISYTIIGSGPTMEEKNLKDLVRRYGLSEIVNIAGSIPHTQLKPWFDSANVGVSYVPLTGYYDCQPVTKTFEYLLSGMPVIATKTSENMKVLIPENSVIVGDSANDFYSGLSTIFVKRHLYDSTKIRNEAVKYTWKNIIIKNLKKYFEGIIQ